METLPSAASISQKDYIPPAVDPNDSSKQQNSRRRVCFIIIISVIIILVILAIAIPIALSLNGDDQSHNQVIDENQSQNQQNQENQDQSTDQEQIQNQQDELINEDEEQPQDQQEQTSDEPIDEEQPQLQDPRQYCEFYPSRCQGVSPEIQQNILSAYPDDQNQIAAVVQMVREISSLDTTQETQNSNIVAYAEQFRTYECMSYIFQQQQLIDVYSRWIEEVLDTEEKWERYFRMVADFSTQAIEPTNNLNDVCQFNIISTRRRRLLQYSNTTGCSDRIHTTLMFTNGVSFTPDGAYENIVALRNLVNTRVSRPIVLYDFQSTGYRDSNFFLEILQVFDQRRLQRNQNPIDRFTSWKALRYVLLRSFSSNVDVSQIEIQSVNELLNICLEISYSTISNNIAANYQYHFRKIDIHLFEKRKVIIVAHSYGALYANHAYSLLSQTQKQSVSLVFVGAAASSISDGSSNWIRNPEDTILNDLVISTIPDPLPSNVTGKSFLCNISLGIFCPSHSFVSYVTYYPDQIYNMIYRANQTEVPSGYFPSVPITVRLTSDQPTYVDLYVQVPYGRQVNYVLRRSDWFGYLVRYPTNSFRPQYFIAWCQKMTTGNFKIRLGFTPGMYLSQGNVSIRAGTRRYVRDFVHTVAVAEQNLDDAPTQHIDIATVQVTRIAQDTQFKFDIIPA